VNVSELHICMCIIINNPDYYELLFIQSFSTALALESVLSQFNSGHIYLRYSCWISYMHSAIWNASPQWVRYPFVLLFLQASRLPRLSIIS